MADLPEPCQPRIRNRQRGPLPRCYWFQCSCGARSPETVDRQTAAIAYKDHTGEAP